MSNALGLGEGDVIELIGKRLTPARAILPYPEDEGLNIIRLDGLQRANAEIGSGDFVEIRKAETKPAQRVVFAPAQKNLRLQGRSEEHTSELQSLMRISYAVFCLKKKKKITMETHNEREKTVDKKEVHTKKS